jgi:hypothetical protein
VQRVQETLFRPLLSDCKRSEQRATMAGQPVDVKLFNKWSFEDIEVSNV